jgi:hypothetical protein
MLNHSTVLVLGYTMLETRAENTKKVTAWHNKQKETAPKQDISEDLQEFLGPKLQRAKTQPFRPFLGVLSVAQLLCCCGHIDLFVLSILSTCTSKTEFVCKSYGQLKFAIENRRKLTKLSNSDWNRTGLVGTGQPDLDADLTFFFCSSSSSCMATET